LPRSLENGAPAESPDLCFSAVTGAYEPRGCIPLRDKSWQWGRKPLAERQSYWPASDACKRERDASYLRM
jgi:hypothetical protein